MIKTLFLHPLGPALILALGGLMLRVFSLASRGNGASRPFAAGPHRPAWLSGRLRVPQAPIALLIVFAAGVVLVLLRLTTAAAAPPDLRWGWQPLTVAGSELNWRLDNWNWLVALLILLLVATALLLEESSTQRPLDPARTLWLGAAATAFVFSGNVVTLASCWVLLDGTLALRLGAGESEEPAGRAWSLLTLAGLLVLMVALLLGEGGIRANLVRGPFDSLELALLWLAALLRAGAYPFHLWLTGPGKTDAAGRVTLHLIAPMTGLWLLTRLHEIGGPVWLRRPEWVALGTLALLGSALAAWSAPNRERSWRWVAINRVSLVMLSAYAADLAGPPALVWPVVSFALGMALLAVGQAARARWGWAWPVWLGALTVWGLPGTPGLLARSALVLPVNVPAALFLFIMLIIAETLLVASLWELATGRETATETEPHAAPAVGRRFLPANSAAFLTYGAIIILLAVPTLGWGVAPQQLGQLLGLQPGGRNLSLWQVLLEARRSVWVVLVISGAAGAALGIYRKRIFAEMRGWQQGVSTIVGLDWLYKAILAGLSLAGGGLRYFALLGEGEGYVGWLALAALILYVLLRS